MTGELLGIGGVYDKDGKKKNMRERGGGEVKGRDGILERMLISCLAMMMMVVEGGVNDGWNKDNNDGNCDNDNNPFD